MSEPLAVREAPASYQVVTEVQRVRPGYKQTEVGVIPEDWVVTVLGAVSELSSGTTPSRALMDRYYRNGSVAWVKTLDLNDSDINSTEESVTELALKETCLRPYPIETVLVAMYGGFNQIGRTGLLRIPAAVNQAITAIRPTKGVLVSDYLIRNLNFRVGYWKHVASSSRKDPNITSNDIRNFPIACPRLREQEAIAEALSDADALIETLTQLITKKRHLKQAAMQELLTGKKRLPGFIGEWEMKRLEDVADIDPDNLSSATSADYTFNYISLEDVDFGSLRSYSEQVFHSAPSRARRRLRAGDILVSTVRPNLQSHLLFASAEPNWICSTGFSVVRCRTQDAVPGYIFSHIFGHLVTKQIETLLTGSNYPAINGRDVKALEIPMPKLPEQTAIAAILSDMDTEIAALETRLTKTRELKQGMMHNLLTGAIRLI